MQLNTEGKWDQIIMLRTDEVHNKVFPGERRYSWWLWKTVSRGVTPL